MQCYGQVLGIKTENIAEYTCQGTRVLLTVKERVPMARHISIRFAIHQNKEYIMTNPTFYTTHHPNQLHPTVFIAPHAVIVGDVTLAEQCGVWFHATLRGDVEPIRIGPRTNIQEGAVLHVDPGFPVTVGAGVTIGHRAIVHGATVHDNVIIGMGSTVLNGAVIGENSIVGANALVTEGKVFPPDSLILGSPAKVVRSLTEDEITRIRQGAETYVARAAAFKSVRDV